MTHHMKGIVYEERATPRLKRERECEYRHCNQRGRGFQVCARCRRARYCCKEHQELDWQEHRRYCRAVPGYTV